MYKATNSSSMKEQNRKLVLDFIRQEGAFRANIADQIGLSKASVSIIVDELLKEKIIFQKKADINSIGRRPILLQINKDAFYSVGINIARHKYEVGIIDMDGNIIQKNTSKLDCDDPVQVLNDIASLVKAQLHTAGITDEKVLGIGVTTPGPVDYINKSILFPPNFNNWHNVKIGKILHSLLGFGIHHENVSNAHALSEKYYGLCKNEKNYIVIIVDEGVGAGIVVNGQIYRGRGGFGNELGHTSIDYNGIPCECGNIGCLEKYASIPAILKDTGYMEWRDVIDRQDINIMRKEAIYLSTALVNVINLFDLSLIILEGSIKYNGEILARFLKKEVNSRVITKNKVNVATSKSIDGVTTAGCIAINSFFS